MCAIARMLTVPDRADIVGVGHACEVPVEATGSRCPETFADRSDIRCVWSAQIKR